MKKYVLYALAISFAASVSLFALFKSPTTEDGVPINPEQDFSFKAMDPKDQNVTGVDKLTALEKSALEKWVSQWEHAVAQADSNTEKDPIDFSALPTPPPAPQMPKNYGTNTQNQQQQQQTAQNLQQTQQQNPQQQQTAQNIQQTQQQQNPQQQQATQNTQQQQQQNPQQQTTAQNPEAQNQNQQPVAAEQGANSSVQETIEEGKYLVVDNGLTYKIPTPLRKKTCNWKQGDLLRVEDTRKAGWIRITNLISGEFVLCKIETNPPQKQQ